MSPFAVAWIVVDITTLVAVAAITARDGRHILELRTLMAGQVLVIASAITATLTSPNAYAEWTLMVAVNLSYALASWRGGATARALATLATAATILAVALIALKAFSSIVALAIGLVFAVGAVFAALVQVRHARARA